MKEMKFSNPRILCVDDDPHTRDWIRVMLKSSKLNAMMTVATSGREAFTLLRQEDFDLCILEYALPDMTGVQLCSLMRQTGCNVPMMFYTAMNRPVDREKAKKAGANDYLCKSDNIDLFIDTVIHLLTRCRPIHGEASRSLTLPKAA